MARNRHSPDEIVAKLHHVDILKSEGQPVAEAVRSTGMSEATYYRLRAEYGGLARLLRPTLKLEPAKPKT
jgi:putative transposase